MSLIWLNLCRSPIRTALTVFGTAIALALFCLLEALLGAFNAGAEMASASRLVVQHKESLTFLLPQAYASRIGQVEGIKGVAQVTWFGGLYETPLPEGGKREEFFANFAVDMEQYLKLIPEVIISPVQYESLLKDRTGCLIGDKLAERLGKGVGDRISLRPLLWPKKDGHPWDFTVRAIYTSNSEVFDRTLMVFHHKYLEEGRVFGKGETGSYLVGLKSASQFAEVSDAIDRLFSNSPNATRTMSEKAFNMQFISMMGNLKLLFRFIGTVVIFTMLLISANTMMMSGRERTREMAILKAIGFSDRHVFTLLVGESIAISLLGFLVGAFGMYTLINLAHWNPKPDFLSIFQVPDAAMISALGIAILTGLVSGFLPGLAAMRLQAAEALRSI
ncbi:MAG: ABC transporter permease [Candidatus Riflebacteria bacterium]|nr:ABC transporter permease [Candidatus Riflebacteria bacterium]